jgi:hypothetical protein
MLEIFLNLHDDYLYNLKKINMIKKLNKYLIENHPLTWHSKFVFLLLTGLIIWTLSYIIGYITTNYDYLTTSRISEIYFESKFVLYHAISVLIVLVVWAISFYKNNALKSLYPLQRFYYFKIFLQLFIGFFFIISAYIPFTYAAHQKATKILPKSQMIADADTFNLAAPFLLFDYSLYDLKFRVYPNPFPISYFEFDNEDYKWDNKNVYHVKNLNNKQYIETDSLYQANLNNPYFSDKEYILDNYKRILFYRTESRYTSIDSCKSNDFIKEIVDLSAFRLSANDLYNFSIVLTSTNNHTNTYIYENDNEQNDFNTDLFYKQRYAPKINQILNEKDTKSINSYYNNFKKTAEKYGILYRLDNDLLINYLLKKEFKNFNYNIVGSFYESKKNKYKNFQDFDNGTVSEAVETSAQAVYDTESDLSNFEITKAYEEYIFKNQPKMFVEFEKINQLYANYKDTKLPFDQYDIFLILLIIASLASAIFIWFEITNIISLLISIPIAGVISILVGLSVALMNKLGIHNDKYYINLCLIVAYTILVLTAISIFYNKINKKVSNILINIAFPIIIFIIPITITHINNITKSEISVKNKCGEYIEKHIPGQFDYFMNLESMLTISVLSFFMFLLVIKKWRAKKLSS